MSTVESLDRQQRFWQDMVAWGLILLEAQQQNSAQTAQALRREAQQCWMALQRQGVQAAEAGVVLPLPYLVAAFELEELQAQCLALSLLAEVEQSFVRAYAQLEPTAQGGVTLNLALRLICGMAMLGAEQWRALLPEGALLHWCMEEHGFAGAVDSSRILKPCRRVMDFVLAGQWEEAGIAGLSLWRTVEEKQPPERLTGMARRMKEYLSAAPTGRTSFLLRGQVGAGRRTLAKTLASSRQEPILFAEGRRLGGEEGGQFRRALMREALLQRCPVCFTGMDALLEEAGADPVIETMLVELLAETAGICGYSLLICEGEWLPREEAENWRVASVVLPLPTLEESRTFWVDCLKNYPFAQSQNPDQLAGKYRFTPGQMERALAEASALACWDALPGIDSETLAKGCRRQLRHGLGEKARRVEAGFGWEELILPAHSKALLRSACDQMKHRPQVYGTWGFGEKLPYGAGLSLLFSGPPGTGKTMAAQIVAGELGLELYKVELSAVVSKYVGETEKNLSEIFREASRSQAILFFDEADVLFGKRTEVKDSHDKYSNMEAAYLLQKIEEYAGVSVLATNFVQNFDEAFKRRLKFIIDFPFPDAKYRHLLWRGVFPTRMPLEAEVDWEYLAGQFELSGSSIKNVAVNAAFLAAGDGTAVGMRQILVALKRELFKSGKLLSREDFGEYYMLAEEDEYGSV